MDNITDRYRELVESHQALAAHVSRLKAACQLAVDMFVVNNINVPNTIEALQDIIDQSPQTSLAERDAKIYADGYVQGYNHGYKLFVLGSGFKPENEDDLREYAERVKRGEI